MTNFCVVWRTWTTTANFSYFYMELNAFVAYISKRIRKNMPPRFSPGDGNENVTKQKVHLTKQWFCTCILNICAFLYRPLQSNNVKWSSCMYFGERVQQWLAWASSSRSIQSRNSKVKYKVTFFPRRCPRSRRRHSFNSLLTFTTLSQYFKEPVQKIIEC